MSYRDNIPHMDQWVMARPKLGTDDKDEPIRYYGSFPSGFLERAIDYLGVQYAGRVLHVCGGRVRDYHSGPTPGGPGGRGLGPLHYTVDLDPDLKPDFLMDVRKLGTKPGDLFPLLLPNGDCKVMVVGKDTFPGGGTTPDIPDLWDAALVDRPYSAEDAAHYKVGSEVWPDNLNDLLRRSLQVTRPSGRVGTLDYLWPMPPGHEAFEARLLVKIGVAMGWNNRERVYVVYERTPTAAEMPRLEERARWLLKVGHQDDSNLNTDAIAAKAEELARQMVTERLASLDPLLKLALEHGIDPMDVRRALGGDPELAERARSLAFRYSKPAKPVQGVLYPEEKVDLVTAAGKALAVTTQPVPIAPVLDAADRLRALTGAPTPQPVVTAPATALMEGFE